jgi:hypothetical protein
MTDDGGRDPKPHNDDDMDDLLKAIRAVAREDDAAIASFSGDVPELSREARGTISERILALQAESRGGAAGRVDGSLATRRERRRGRAALWAGAGVVLAAAAWALVVWTQPPSGIGGTEGAVPAYSVIATGGVADNRGPGTDDGASGRTAPVQHMGAQSELRIACRPDSAVAGPVAVRTFFVQGGTVEEVRPDVEVAPTGAVALRIRGSALPAHHDGPGELRVVVGRPAVVSALSKPLDATDGEGDRWLFVPLQLAN